MNRIAGIARVLTVVVFSGWAAAWTALFSAAVPSASAQPCPDVQVVFARGTTEAPGVGGIGQSFVDSLRGQVGSRSLDVYAVNYPASNDFAASAISGISDASGHLRSMAGNCPNTRMVLGGYSQGAAVAGFVTSAAVPPGIPASAVPPPMPPDVADHVAAVVLFGTPSAQFLGRYGAPPIVIGPLYQPKTLQLCAPGDTICDGTPGGGPTAAHALYAVNGMTNQGAAFAAGKL